MRGFRLVVGVLAFAAAVPVMAQQAEAPAPPAASVSQLEAAIKGDPANPKLYVALGLAYWDKRDSPRALEAFQRAVKVGPRSAEAHNWLGVALAAKSDLPGAIAAFKKAIALDPKYGRAYTNLGSVLAKSGESVEAVAVFQKALALEPNSEAAHLNLGMALRETGNPDAALEHLQPVAIANPTNARIQDQLGQTLRQKGDLAAAVAAFEKALEIEPEMREGYYALGVALKQQSASARKPRPSAASAADALYARAQDTLAQGDLNSAREQLAEALRLDEHHADSHNLLGFILGQQGDFAGALVHLERAVALQPESSEAHYNLGVAQWYSGSKDRALAELWRSVSLDPAAGASQAFLGTALRDTGDLPRARASLQRAIALLPPTAAVYVDLGITYLRAGEVDKALGQLEAGLNLASPPGPMPDWDGAIAGLRRALAANTDPAPAAAAAPTPTLAAAEAHHVLGLLLGRRGADSHEVAAEFREAIRLQPDFAEAHNHLGLVPIQADQDEEGLAALREAVRISPDYADAHANLGAALTPTNPKEAIKELEKAVALAPDSVKVQFNLATAYGASPDLGPAKEIEQLRKVVGLAPTFARAHLALGKALLQDGKVAEAVTELQEMTRLEPASGEAHYQLGLALARAGRSEEAAAELRKGRELVAADDRNQNAALDIADARAAVDKGDLGEAAAKLRHALQLQPASFEAQRYLDIVLKKQNEGAAASAGDDRKKVAEFETYFRQGRFKEVEPLLSAYVAQSPKSAWGWYALGYSLFAQQKIGASISALAKSLELDIRNADAHKTLGRDLMIIGRFDAAQVEFEQGLRYKPDSAEIQYDLGKLFSIQDNWEPARKAFEAAIRIDPAVRRGARRPRVRTGGAERRRWRGCELRKSDRAEPGAARQLRLRPRQPERLYNRTGDTARALEYARQGDRARTVSPTVPGFRRVGRKSVRVGWTMPSIRSTAPSPSIRGHLRTITWWRISTAVSARWKRAGRRSRRFTRLERETSEIEKQRRGGIPRQPRRRP